MSEDQRDRIEALRRKITPKQYDFVRKELMLNLNMDITTLLDAKAFDRVYAYKDGGRDEQLEGIRAAENRWQGLGLVGALAFGALSVKQRDIRYFAPGVLLMGGLKYYSTQVRQEMMRAAPGLEEYWRKSRKLTFDLRKTEQYLEQRKLLDKAN